MAAVAALKGNGKRPWFVMTKTSEKSAGAVGKKQCESDCVTFSLFVKVFLHYKLTPSSSTLFGQLCASCRKDSDEEKDNQSWTIISSSSLLAYVDSSTWAIAFKVAAVVRPLVITLLSVFSFLFVVPFSFALLSYH